MVSNHIHPHKIQDKTREGRGIGMASSLVGSILVVPISRCHQLQQRLPLLASATPPSTHKARFVARRKESVSVQQLQRPLSK